MLTVWVLLVWSWNVVTNINQTPWTRPSPNIQKKAASGLACGLTCSSADPTNHYCCYTLYKEYSKCGLVLRIKLGLPQTMDVINFGEVDKKAIFMNFYICKQKAIINGYSFSVKRILASYSNWSEDMGGEKLIAKKI